MGDGWFDNRMQQRSEQLFQKRTVAFEGEVESKEMERLKRLIHTLQLKNQKPIRLLIDSSGGKVDAAVAFYDFIRSEITSLLIGRVSGKCASSATIVLQACGRREATKNSWFLLHSVALEMSPLVNRPEFRYGADLRRAADFIVGVAEEQQTIIEQIYCTRTGQPRGIVRQWLRAGDLRLAPFRAHEAKRRHLIDYVV